MTRMGNAKICTRNLIEMTYKMKPVSLPPKRSPLYMMQDAFMYTE